MAFSKLFVVLVVALLSICVGTHAEDSAAIATSDGGDHRTGLALGGASTRGLLGKKNKRGRKNRRKNRKGAGNVNNGNPRRINLNGENAVIVNQDNFLESAGSENDVSFGGTAPIYNIYNRKLAWIEEGEEGVEDAIAGQRFHSRDLLKKRRKKKNKSSKKNVKRARSTAINQNAEGVLINQQGSVNIEGDGNGVAVGSVSPVTNINFDVGDITGRRLSARDLLKKKKKKNKKSRKNVKSARSTAINQNAEGVLVNQQGSVNIDGDGNGVVVGETSEITNTNVDVGDCTGFACLLLLSGK